MILFYFVSTGYFVFLDLTHSSMAGKSTGGVAAFSALLKGPNSSLLNTRTAGYCFAALCGPQFSTEILGNWE